MPDYSWVCHSCKNSNPPATQVCQTCGFPAVASGAEIQEAITGIKNPPRQSRKEFLSARQEEIAALQLWKKPTVYALRVVEFVGAVIVWAGIFDLSLLFILLGVVVVFAAELIYQLVKGKPYAWQSN